MQYSTVLGIQPEHMDMSGDNEKPQPMYMVKWDYLSRQQLQVYSRNSDANLPTVHIDHKLAVCKSPMYKDTDHIFKSCIPNWEQFLVCPKKT